MADLTSVQQRRREIKIYSWTGAALMAGCLLAINFIVSFLPLRLDTSDGHIYSVSSGTKTVLKKLDDTLLVRIMFSSQLPPAYKLNEQYVTDLLSEYRRASHGRIRVEYFDPGKSPKDKEEAMEAGVQPVQLDVRERDRRETKECFMGLSLRYGDKAEAIGFIQDTSNLEYEITQRIKKLINPERTSIGFATNGAALDLSSEPLKNLQAPVGQLYDVRSVDLSKPVPADLKSLWVIGPSGPLGPDALGNIRSYLAQGGTVGMLLDRRNVNIMNFTSTPLQTDVDSFLDEWGVKFKEGFISDARCDRIEVREVRGMFQMVNVIDYPFFPWITDMDRGHPATRGIDGFSMPFVAPLVIDQKKPDVTTTVLAKTSEQSWLDGNPSYMSPVETRPRAMDAVTGPFNVAMLLEKKAAAPNTKPGRLILFGSSRFINKAYPPRQTNYVVFLNMLDWSVQDEVLLSIRSKGVARRVIRPMSDPIRALLKYLMIFALPIAAAVIGLSIWRAQKMRRALLPLVYREA